MKLTEKTPIGYKLVIRRRVELLGNRPAILCQWFYRPLRGNPTKNVWTRITFYLRTAKRSLYVFCEYLYSTFVRNRN